MNIHVARSTRSSIVRRLARVDKRYVERLSGIRACFAAVEVQSGCWRCAVGTVGRITCSLVLVGLLPVGCAAGTVSGCAPEQQPKVLVEARMLQISDAERGLWR